MFVCCEYCVLSSRGLCVELITRPEEYYQLWRFVVCDLETSRMRRPYPVGPQLQKREPNTEASESRVRTFVCDHGFQTCSPYGQGSALCVFFCRAEALK